MPTYDLMINGESKISSALATNSPLDEPIKVIQVSNVRENDGCVEIKTSADEKKWITAEKIDPDTGLFVPMVFTKDDMLQVHSSSCGVRAIYTGTVAEEDNTIEVTIS